jgi:hypothetical protein
LRSGHVSCSSWETRRRSGACRPRRSEGGEHTVADPTEIDEFDSSGFLTKGFDLQTAGGVLGAGYFTDFAFDPSAATAAPELATRSMMMIGFDLFAAISWRKVGLRRRNA